MLTVVVFAVKQIRDADGGLTINKTRSFDRATLKGAPLSFYDSYGDDRNTTYSPEIVPAPAFDSKYAQVRRLKKAT
jgi:hypothetical protein